MPSVRCPSGPAPRSLRSREVTPSTYRSQELSQILLNRLRRRRRAPPLRKFASHAPNLRKQHECAVYVVSDLTTEDASPGLRATRKQSSSLLSRPTEKRNCYRALHRANEKG